MQRFFIFATFSLLVFGTGILAGASEGNARPKNGDWCLDTSTGGAGGGGGIMTLCRYATLEQCIESKVAHGDQCYRNPQRR